MTHPTLWSLTGTAATTVYLSCLALAVLFILLGLRHARNRRRVLGSLLITVAVIAAVWLLLEVIWKPFPESAPAYIYLAGGISLWALTGVVLQRGRRGLLALATVLALIGTAGTLNLAYQLYPTVRSLNPVPAAVHMNLEQFRATTTPPEINGREVGALVSFHLAGVSSGFNGRDAVAYIPPAYWTRPALKLPVIVLLAGNPGDPMQWFTSGEAEQIADDRQAAHEGAAPIVVSVDGTGSYSGNPVCVDGPELRVQTYLAVDVPDQLKATFRVDPDQSHWTIGGLSYGGTCSLQVITNAPESYGSFLDISGQAEPTVGSHRDTVNQFFGGDEAAFNAVDPAHLLQSRRYAGIEGRFVAGTQDPAAREALSHLNDLANAAGMVTTYSEVTGAHTFETWRQGLLENFEWAAQRGGL